MTRQQATREACAIVALAYNSIGDYRHASDGFCDLCPNGEGQREEDYRNEGHVLDYVRDAVVEKLRRDGHSIAEGFDQRTGRELRHS